LTDDENRTAAYVPYEEFRPVKQLADRHEVALFGIFSVDNVRVKGLLEQHQDSTEAIAGVKTALEQTNASINEVKRQVTSVAWSIAKPILACLGILIVVGVGAVLVAGYGILHPDTIHAVTGH
jgi:esterase/lipase superfamily enzyme